MPEKSSLEEYQDALVKLLSSGSPQASILESMKTDPRFQNYQDYVKNFDPDMVEVACELMGKWAKQSPD